METMSVDVLIVGFGKGGKTIAHELADAGKQVALVEQSANMYGGTCPNVGCVPTKMLVHYANGRRDGDDAQGYFAHSIAGVRDLTATFRAGNFESLDGKPSAAVLTGTARFTDPNTVTVGEGTDQVTVTAPTIVISTGAAPIVPAIPGLKESSHLVTSTELTQTSSLPERLVVIGGGYQGLEFASIYQHFGTHVTVLEAAPRILPRADEDIASAAAEILAGDGITLVTGAKVVEVKDTGATSTVVFQKDGERQTVEAGALLPATGRRAVTDDLHLDAAGLQTRPNGSIQVDDQLRTSQPHIYAVGDVNGGPQFTYIALDDARIVIDQLLGEGKRSVSDRVAVPTTLFITPPLAAVGLTEKEAREQGLAIKVSREKVADIIAMPRAYTVEETRGLMKFIVDKNTDLILGAVLLSIDAQEIINTVALAMRFNITATELRNSIYTHPSSTEALNEVFDNVIS